MPQTRGRSHYCSNSKILSLTCQEVVYSWIFKRKPQIIHEGKRFGDIERKPPSVEASNSSPFWDSHPPISCWHTTRSSLWTEEMNRQDRERCFAFERQRSYLDTQPKRLRMIDACFNPNVGMKSLRQDLHYQLTAVVTCAWVSLLCNQ